MPDTKEFVQNRIAPAGITANVLQGLPGMERLFYLDVFSSESMDVWQKLSCKTNETGYSPLIWHDRESALSSIPGNGAVVETLVKELATFGIEQNEPLDIAAVNDRLIEKRMSDKYFGRPIERVTNQKEARQIDALIQIDDMHSADLASQGCKPREFPADKSKMDIVNRINQKYSGIKIRIMNDDMLQSALKVMTTLSLQPTAAQIKQVCNEADSLNFDAWLTTTEKQNGYDKVEQGTFSYASASPKNMANEHEDTKQSADKVVILLLPTKRSWQIPAYVGFGGVNSNPDVTVHIAAMKRWHQKYGAKLISLTPDLAKFYVAKPPNSEFDSMQLAREHYIYCPELIDTGADTLGTLADSICDNHYWQFWWD